MLRLLSDGLVRMACRVLLLMDDWGLGKQDSTRQQSLHLYSNQLSLTLA